MIIPVKTEQGSYDIVLERGALDKVGELLDLDRRVLVVTDSGVPIKYARSVAKQCKESKLLLIKSGEASKCFRSLEGMLSAMLNFSLTRGDCIVAVGGGVVGDLSGFAASCYMRGIDFYNIPTTLLSQVDSSIGGKTAIDFGKVKNAVGTFYQPKKVVIDPDVLSTLDDRQLHAGLAEAIKMAATSDKELFELIAKSENIRGDIVEVIRRSLMIKKDVVEQDPKESGLRRVLNFGHTVGHAIESLESGKLLHGECIALGMLPMCSEEVRARLLSVLEKYSLPTKSAIAPERMASLIGHDKKVQGGCVNAVTVNEIGSFEFVKMSADEIIEKTECLR